MFTSMRTTATSQADSDKKTIDTESYKKLLEDYRSFEDKKKAISDEYDKKRAEAQANNNTELVNKLNDAQAKAMSSLATEELTGSEAWSNLFGNLDEMAAKDIETLIQQIEAQFDTLSVKFDPIDLAAIRTKLEQAKGVLIADNPFKQLGKAMGAVFNGGAKDAKKSATEIKKDWKNMAGATEASFNFVNDAISSCDVLKDAIGAVGTTAISSLQTLAMTAIGVATAIKSAEKGTVILAIIQAALMVVQAVMSVVTAMSASHDKKLENSINKHKSNVKSLEQSYETLERAIDKALSGADYGHQKNEIENLKRQQKEYSAMILDERAKKKTDQGKIDEYSDQIRQLKYQIEDIVTSMREDILGSSIQDIANDLSGALFDAFAAGEDAAAAWGKKVDEIVGNIIKKMLMQKLVEQPVGNILNKYTSKWVDASGSFLGADNIMQSAQEMGKELSSLGPNLAKLMESMPDNIKKYLFGDSKEGAATAMSGSIQSVTEETAGVLSGQINAMRIIQLESQELIRQQLGSLTEIASNTRVLKVIDSRLAVLITNGDSRSQGF